MHRLVGHRDVPRRPVCVGIDGDGRDAQTTAGVDHAAGDLAPVRDQDLVEHQVPSSNAACKVAARRLSERHEQHALHGAAASARIVATAIRAARSAGKP
jgi:hypothetical protein